MRSATFLSSKSKTTSISICTNKRRALGSGNKYFEPGETICRTFVKVQKFFCSYLLGKIAAPSSWRESDAAAEEFSGRRSQEVTCFARQPTARPPTTTEAKERHSNCVGWRFSTGVNRSQNLVHLGRPLLTLEALQWSDKVFSSIRTWRTVWGAVSGRENHNFIVMAHNGMKSSAKPGWRMNELKWQLRNCSGFQSPESFPDSSSANSETVGCPGLFSSSQNHRNIPLFIPR